MTTIQSIEFNTPLRIRAAKSGRLLLDVGAAGSMRGGSFEREPFLDAVRSELGVLTIDKADLPIVTDRGVHGNLFVADVPWAASLSVKALRQEAYDRLALAEYLEAHPPVDEQQVRDLSQMLIDTGLRISTTDGVIVQDYAHRLLATGKVTVQS